MPSLKFSTRYKVKSETTYTYFGNMKSLQRSTGFHKDNTQMTNKCKKIVMQFIREMQIKIKRYFFF